MNRYEKRKLKANLYKNSNTIMYVTIFVIAAMITIVAAMNRTDKIAYIDESQLTYTEKESVAIDNRKTRKVAATKMQTKETVMEDTAVSETPMAETTVSETQEIVETATEPIAATKIKITADTLCVRAETSTDSEIVGLADMDDIYEVASQNGEWIEINYNGTKGYINSEFAEIIE